MANPPKPLADFSLKPVETITASGDEPGVAVRYCGNTGEVELQQAPTLALLNANVDSSSVTIPAVTRDMCALLSKMREKLKMDAPAAFPNIPNAVPIQSDNAASGNDNATYNLVIFMPTVTGTQPLPSLQCQVQSSFWTEFTGTDEYRTVEDLPPLADALTAGVVAGSFKTPSATGPHSFMDFLRSVGDGVSSVFKFVQKAAPVAEGIMAML